MQLTSQKGSYSIQLFAKKVVGIKKEKMHTGNQWNKSIQTKGLMNMQVNMRGTIEYYNNYVVKIFSQGHFRSVCFQSS